MRLLSLQVTGAACFRNPVRLGGFDSHINIIYGPNESGKSTLITCLARAFFDKSSTRAQEVESLRPWKTTLSPEIVVEFVIGRDPECSRYRLEKRFLDNPHSRLSEWTGAGYELLADGDRAEAFVREMWRSSVPGRGATKIDNWGFARLLWFRQDQDRLKRPPLNDDTLLNELRQTLNVMTITKEEEELFGALEAELGKIVTSKRRDFMNGSRVVELRQQRDELVATIASVDQKLGLVEELSERIVHLRDGIARSISDRDARKTELSKLKEEVDRVKQVRNDLRVAQSQLQELKTRQRTLSANSESIRKAREAIAKLEEELHSIEEDRRRLEKEVKASEKRIAEREKEQRMLRDRLGEAKSKLDCCRRIKQLRSWTQEITQKRSLLDKLKERADELDKVKVELRSMSVPSEADIQKAEELRSQAVTTEARLKAVGLSLEVEAHAEVAVDFASGEEDLRRSDLRAGESMTFHASQEGTLRVPDLFTMRVKSGSGEVVSVQQELERAREEMTSLLARFSVSGVPELHQVAAKADRLKELEKRLQKEIAELTESNQVGLEACIARLQNQLDSGLARESLSTDELDTADLGDEDHLAAVVDDLEAAERNAQEGLDQLRKAAAEDRERWTRLGAQIERNQDIREYHQMSVKNVLKEYSGDESVLESVHTEVCLEIERKEKTIIELETQLPQEGEDPEKRWENLQTELDNIQKDLESKRSEISQSEGRLEEIASGDLYLEKSSAEERLELTERQLERELVRARALRLIQVLFEHHKQAMSSGLSKPIEDKVSNYWGYVRDRSGVKASLDADMELATLDVSGTQVEPELFSAGAREQLYVIARLAVAEILSSREPHIVVLDDAMVFTDSYRHNRMLDLVKRLSEKMQILILTSHEDRFRALPGARFDVSELRSRSLLV